MINIDRLKKKYKVGNLFTFDDSKGEITYNNTLKFTETKLWVEGIVLEISEINYFFFDKTSYLKLQKAELKGERFEFFVTLNYGNEMQIRIYSSDDWVVLQEILKKKNIVIHTTNSLKAKKL